MKLSRTLEQWAGCDPRAMTQQSPAALEFAFQDAKHDIRVLAAANAALQARADKMHAALIRISEDDGKSAAACRGLAIAACLILE